ncbi:MAG: hypothetical protein GF418_08760 [Chitinivibrionales bacterium]|nr:hypothetical protein [Chitinivibrionales bacterium]MBD3395703.1 hypothetical protein [Chitinivibrionales bacterium]
MKHKRFLFAAACTALCIAAGCSGKSEQRIENELRVILDDDLRMVASEISPEHVADSTYYDISMFNEYEQGTYRWKAVVEFFFLKDVNVKMVRKYRYHRKLKKWERYFNQYQFVHE